MKGRRHKPIGFFLISFCHIARSYSLITVRAEYCSVILGKVNRPINNAVIIHLNKIAFPHFLVVSNKCFAMSATHCKYVASTHFFAIWVFKNLQLFILQNLCGIYLLLPYVPLCFSKVFSSLPLYLTTTN